MKVKINRQKALADLSRRVNAKPVAVKEYLRMGGVEPTSNVISLDDLRVLSETNPEAFNRMAEFLYPELTKVAPGDGKNGGEGGGGLSATAEEGLFGLGATFVGTAGQVLTSWLTGADKTASQIYETELEKERAEARNRWIWAGIGLFATVVIVTIVIIAVRGGNTHIVKA